DVQRQAVLARTDELRDALGDTRRISHLGRLRSECERIAHAVPGIDGPGRSHSVRAEGWCGVGHALERCRTIGPETSQLATPGLDNRVHRRVSRLRAAALC